MPASADNPSLRCVLWHSPGVPLPADLLNSLSRRIGHMTVCADPYTAMAEVCAGERDRRCPGAMQAQTDTQPPPDPGPRTVLLLVEPDRLPDLPDLLAEIRTFAPGVLCWKFQERANPKLAAVVDSDVTAWMVRGASAAAGVRSSLSAARTTSNEQRHLSSTSSPFTPANSPRRAPTTSPAPTRPAASQSPPALRLTGDEGAPSAPMSSSVPKTARPRTPEVIVRPPPPIRGKPALILRGEPRPDGSPVAQPPTPAGEGNPGSASPPPAPRPMLTAEELRMLLGDDPIDTAAPKSSNGRHPPGGKPDGGKEDAR